MIDIGCFVVEVNEGVYLIDGEEGVPYVSNDRELKLTRELKKATQWKYLEDARGFRKMSGGRILRHKPNLEVVE
ncbi:hypothetical protein [Staphylococcus pasteuri]|uniref:hypothetical protein n=1 Tax=Staphylococcus pasteuri TaxID=45972 RepID=UPI0003C0A90C|nr:hypothetical protein [Staphylococcus pasteuri]AGZ24962.1 hypothetical protein STP1_0651 [Staphylococcus pasteuri SP1]